MTRRLSDLAFQKVAALRLLCPRFKMYVTGLCEGIACGRVSGAR